MDNVILFDLDGTLLDSTDAIVGTFLNVFKIKGYEKKITDEDIKNLIGYPLDTMFLKLGVDEKYADEFVHEYKMIYREISLAQTYLLPFCIESLELASSFARLGIVTTKTARFTVPLLEHLKISKYFETMVGREHVNMPKPHPEPILLALTQMNKKPSDTVWMIGDTELDLISANEAKINAAGVLCGYGKAENLQIHTKNIFNNSYEAVRFIKKPENHR